MGIRIPIRLAHCPSYGESHAILYEIQRVDMWMIVREQVIEHWLTTTYRMVFTYVSSVCCMLQVCNNPLTWDDMVVSYIWWTSFCQYASFVPYGTISVLGGLVQCCTVTCVRSIEDPPPWGNKDVPVYSIIIQRESLARV